MNKEVVFNSLVELYKTPEIKGLIGALSMYGPIISVVDTAMSAFITKHQEKQLRIIFDKLNGSEYLLTEADIYNNDFLYAYFSTVNYVLRSKTDEKASRFASILKGVFSKEITIDQFEDYTFTLNQLTDREFLVLSIKLKYENIHKSNNNLNSQIKSDVYWDKFMAEVSEILNTDNDSIILIIKLASMKGCYDIDLLWGGNPECKGETTQLFQGICNSL